MRQPFVCSSLARPAGRTTLLILALVPASAILAATLALTYVSFADPLNAGRQTNAIKGTMYFYVNGQQRSLVSYGNADQESGPRQCVELVKRYAARLGFSGFGAALKNDLGTSLPYLGATADQTAQLFAQASGRNFSFVNDGASDLPRAGAVVSISIMKGVLPHGHVGILGNHANPGTATSVSIKIFDQNMYNAQWKVVEFTKRANGRWYGSMANNGTPVAVAGWANPVN